MHKFLKLILSVILTVFIVACSTTGERTIYGDEIDADSSIQVRQLTHDDTLRIATLNIAHGRKDSFSQFFLSKNTIQQNLDDIAQVMNQYQPHVIALQEVDTTESFNHVQYLASQAQYPWRAQVSNVDAGFTSYGTAVLSVLPLMQSIQHTFASSWPTFNKGFVLAQLAWPSSDNKTTQKIDVISVHLDFSRQSVREKQIKEIVDIIAVRNNPTIIMGDFNSEWFSSESVIKSLSTSSRFSTYKPEQPAYNTYKDKRLDWVLISKELEFTDYNVLTDTLSDHAMVMAEVRFKAIIVDDVSCYYN